MLKTTLSDEEKNAVLNEVVFMAATGNLNFSSEDLPKKEMRQQGFNLVRSTDGTIIEKDGLFFSLPN